MNSETLREINQVSPYIEKERARLFKLESEVEEKGKAAQSFITHPFWVIFDKDLERLIEDMNSRLINGTDLKKSQMDRLIDNIRLAKLFRKAPSSYIEKMRLLVNRKLKSRKE